MRKALTILFAVLLACTFVSCSSGNPEPPADNRTQLERADEAISSVSHVFNGVAAEIDDKGNDVYKIENPVQINGMTVNGGTKTVSEDGFNTSVEIEISYEENGQKCALIGTLGYKLSSGGEYRDAKHTTPQAPELQATFRM